MLSTFDHLIGSATRNSSKGEMNVEMAKAQASELMADLTAMSKNVKTEKELA